MNPSIALRMKEKYKVSDRLGIIACYIMAFTSLGAAVYHLHIILPLLDDGIRTEAIVVDIKKGAKNSKWAIYQYQTETGIQLTSRDKFQMYIVRLHKGNHVTVIYDPEKPETVTADLGLWTWQGVVIFMFGFLFLATLGVLILRYKPGKHL